MSTSLRTGTLAAVAVATLVLASPVARASVLTFDKSPTQFAFPAPFFNSPSTPAASEYPDYGDNVTAADLVSGQDVSGVHGAGTKFNYGAAGGPTPDITVSYLGPDFTTSVPEGGMKAYSDSNYPLGLIGHLTTGDPRRIMTLTSSHSWQVVGLSEFTIYGGGGTHSVADVRVVALDGSGNQIGAPLYSSGPTTIGPAPARVFNSADFLAPRLEAKILAIEFDPDGPGSVVVTNAQHNSFVWDNVTFGQVPEPATFSMLGAAAGAFGLRRRGHTPR